MRAVAYVRFSSDSQRSESLDAQLRAIKDYCNSNNLNLVNVYSDSALSGTSANNRTAFLQMISDSKKKLFDFVIVHKLDRFARNSYDHAIYEKKLNDNKVRIISVREQLNNSPESAILKNVLVGMNEYYSLNLSVEVKKGMYENFENNKHTAGIPPLGYDLDSEKRYIINEKEAEIVKSIFQMSLDGMGYGKIAQELNRQGFINKRGRPFAKTSIRDTLLNEKYMGNYVLGLKDKNGKLTGTEQRKEGVIPAIIDKEVFLAIQEMMRKRKTGKRKNQQNYILTGFCECGECGGAFTGGGQVHGRSKKYYVYTCSSRKARKTDCKNMQIRKELLEPIVFDKIREEIFQEDKMQFISWEIEKQIKEKNKNFNSNHKKISSKIVYLEDKKSKLLDAFLDSMISKEEYNTKNQELERDLHDLQLELNSLNNTDTISRKEIMQYLINLSEKFEQKNDDFKRNVIETFVDKVIIYKDRIEIRLQFINFLVRDTTGGSGGN